MSHGKETAVEEVEHDKAAQATNHDDDDDEDSLARLENAYATPVQPLHKPAAQQSRFQDHRRKATPAALVDKPKTPAPIITTKVKSLPKKALLARASRPISMTQISRPNSTRPELYLAKLKQAKQELYERHEALIESVAARRKRSRAGRRPRGRRCVC
ncbi:unnamed protein product [Zymoseptoria tritici ST99CH_1E4]|uniref:Uncharacterized protein n=1 Tax=Zymoseptoria tritici ST99CH_1E4 TaxID=1276532 RepID=A0A2H1HA14_ZYMTR|nr:unnamed protein product [Zymoseptoria tritici ST99CH_1E4]